MISCFVVFSEENMRVSIVLSYSSTISSLAQEISLKSIVKYAANKLTRKKVIKNVTEYILSYNFKVLDLLYRNYHKNMITSQGLTM